MRKYQIADLDGCISDDRWRRDTIKPRPADGSNPPDRFHIYQSLSFSDEAMNLRELRDDCQLIILTARPVKFSQITYDWLKRHKIVPAITIFRNNHDTRPSWDVKRQMVGWLLDYNMHGLNPGDIVEAIDDLAPIVNMYREEFNIPSRIVRIGEEEHIA